MLLRASPPRTLKTSPPCFCSPWSYDEARFSIPPFLLPLPLFPVFSVDCANFYMMPIPFLGFPPFLRGSLFIIFRETVVPKPKLLTVLPPCVSLASPNSLAWLPYLVIVTLLIWFSSIIRCQCSKENVSLILTEYLLYGFLLSGNFACYFSSCCI